MGEELQWMVKTALRISGTALPTLAFLPDFSDGPTTSSQTCITVIREMLGHQGWKTSFSPAIRPVNKTHPLLLPPALQAGCYHGARFHIKRNTCCVWCLMCPFTLHGMLAPLNLQLFKNRVIFQCNLWIMEPPNRLCKSGRGLPENVVTSWLTSPMYMTFSI